MSSEANSCAVNNCITQAGYALIEDCNNSSMLVLFARAPCLGAGKRRIAAELGDQVAHAINQGMYAAAIGDLDRWQGPTAVALAGVSHSEFQEESANPDTSKQRLYLAQPEASFGARIKAIETKLRQHHNNPLIFIGSDAPELAANAYQQAALTLDAYDVVLAPATDGGVTLLGVRESWPELEQLPWGSSSLCDALAAQCIKAGLAVGFIDTYSDVDTVDDLFRLRHSLAKDTRPQQAQLLHDLREALPDITAVIPVRGDHHELQSLAQELQSQNVDHIQVVDHDHSDATQALCEAMDLRYASDNSSRGKRLDIGARIAHDGALWFLHADTKLLPGAANAVRRHLLHHDAGFFKFCFSGDASAKKKWLAKAINWRAEHFIPYGDQGLFMSKRIYLASGGFADEPLFEEVPLIKYLRRNARIAATDHPIGVSERRWQKDGWIRRTLHNRWLVIRYMLGTSPADLANSYNGK